MGAGRPRALVSGLPLAADPFFPLSFLVNSWLPGMLDDLFQSVFLCALLLFWLCVYHGIRVQVSRGAAPALLGVHGIRVLVSHRCPRSAGGAQDLGAGEPPYAPALLGVHGIWVQVSRGATPALLGVQVSHRVPPLCWGCCKSGGPGVPVVGCLDVAGVPTA